MILMVYSCFVNGDDLSSADSDVVVDERERDRALDSSTGGIGTSIIYINQIETISIFFYFYLPN
jgi:hypothetical protein